MHHDYFWLQHDTKKTSYYVSDFFLEELAYLLNANLVIHLNPFFTAINFFAGSSMHFHLVKADNAY